MIRNYLKTAWRSLMRIAVNPIVFVLAGLAAIVITIVTISFQALKAAIANPVKSLRTE